MDYNKSSRLPPSRGRGGVRGNTLRDRRSVCKNWENVNSGTLSLVSLWLLLFKNSHFILYKMSWNWNVWWRNLDKQRLTLNWRKWSLKLTQQTQVCLWIVWSWSKRDRYPQISVRNNELLNEAEYHLENYEDRGGCYPPRPITPSEIIYSKKNPRLKTS